MEDAKSKLKKLFGSISYKHRFDEKQKKYLYKNSKYSTSTRSKANSIFNQSGKKEVSDIFSLYNESISTAPLDSEELALAFSARAVFLFNLKEYEHSIKDLDRAINITKRVDLQLKWFYLKLKYLLKSYNVVSVGEHLEEAKKFCSQIQKFKQQDNLLMPISNLEYIIKNGGFRSVQKKTELPEGKDKLNNFCLASTINVQGKIKSSESDQKALNNFSSVSMNYTVDDGNHFVSKKSIQAGKLILRESPHLLTSFGPVWSQYCCRHCLQFCISAVPCEDCNWYIFCGESCRKAAYNSYHKKDCYYLALCRDNGVDSLKELSLRIIFAAVDEAGSISNLKEKLQAIDHCGGKL